MIIVSILFAYLNPSIPKNIPLNKPVMIVTHGARGAPTIITIPASKDLVAKFPKIEKPIEIPVFNNNFPLYKSVNFHFL